MNSTKSCKKLRFAGENLSQFNFYSIQQKQKKKFRKGKKIIKYFQTNKTNNLCVVSLVSLFKANMTVMD